jgi:hypothetical protein
MDLEKHWEATQSEFDELLGEMAPDDYAEFIISSMYILKGPSKLEVFLEKIAESLEGVNLDDPRIHITLTDDMKSIFKPKYNFEEALELDLCVKLYKAGMALYISMQLRMSN